MIDFRNPRHVERPSQLMEGREDPVGLPGDLMCALMCFIGRD